MSPEMKTGSSGWRPCCGRGVGEGATVAVGEGEGVAGCMAGGRVVGVGGWKGRVIAWQARAIKERAIRAAMSGLRVFMGSFYTIIGRWTMDRGRWGLDHGPWTSDDRGRDLPGFKCLMIGQCVIAC